MDKYKCGGICKWCIFKDASETPMCDMEILTDRSATFCIGFETDI